MINNSYSRLLYLAVMAMLVTGRELSDCDKASPGVKCIQSHFIKVYTHLLVSYHEAYYW